MDVFCSVNNSSWLHGSTDTQWRLAVSIAERWQKRVRHWT